MAFNKQKLLKIIRKGDTASAKKIIDQHEHEIELDSMFAFACQGSTESMLRFLLDKWIVSKFTAGQFNSKIEDGVMFLIQKNNSFFFEAVKHFKNNRYNDAKNKFFITAARFGNLDIVNFYLNDKDIDPSQDKNNLIMGLFRKTKISPNANNIQIIIKYLKRDPRVLKMAINQEQWEAVDDTAAEFIFI